MESTGAVAWCETPAPSAAESVECLPRKLRTRRERRQVVEHVREILSVRYAEPLLLQELAEIVGLSRFHLARLFRRETGSSIHGELLAIRLRIAHERVVAGDSDLAALALDVGFCNHSHFTKSFRRYFGVAPSKVRRTLGHRAIAERKLRARSRPDHEDDARA